MGKRLWPAAALRASLLSATAIMAMTNAAVAQEQRQTLNIPAQNTAEALTEFSRQAQVQILFPHAVASRFTSPALQGAFTRSEAIGRLIAGSGLVIRSDDERTIVLGENGASPTQFGAAGDAAPSDDEEIIVTGTHIRGIGDGTNHVLAFDCEGIERSGYSSTQQVLEAIPQNFSGGSLGASEDGLVGGGVNSHLNHESASAVNLRGLGPNSTLVLINGHRVAPSAVGSVVDVSMIPLSAIDRVEILADGSSAIYGSDAIAGVVNFVLRDELNGAETLLRYGAAEGGLDEATIGHSMGLDWDRGNALLSLQYHSRDALPASEREFSSGAPQPTDLIPEVEDYSDLITAEHELTPRITLNGDVLYTDKEVHRQYATTANVESSRAYTEQLNVTVGATFDLFSDWQLRASASAGDLSTELYLSSNPPSFYPNGPKTLDNRFELTSFDAVADGALFRLPAGAARLALGASHAGQEFVSIVPYTDPLLDPIHERRFDRTVDTVFGELYLPLADSLDVSLALRYDDYSDFGDTTNPRIGFVWRALDELEFRGSYSTAFRAPTAMEQFGTLNAQSLVPLPPGFFPGPGGTTPIVLVVCCSKPLEPEESENYTLGATYRPSWAAGARFDVTYYSIDFQNRIISPPFDPAALLQPGVYGSLITPFASDAEAQAFINALTAEGYVFNDLFGVGMSGIEFAYDQRQQNAASVEQEGIDVSVARDFTVGADAVSARFSASYISEINTALTATSEPVDLVNTYGNPLRFRARADLAWERGPLQLAGAINYWNAYDDTSVIPTSEADAWTTVDLNLTFNPPAIEGLSLALSVVNAFDEEPPYVGGTNIFDFSGIHYDTANADPLGRFVSFSVRKRW